MKKSVALLLAVLLCFTLCSCGQKVESITLKESEVKIKVDDTYKIEYEILPEDIENPNLTWSSSDNTIASVDEKGQVNAISEGEAEITVTAGKNVSAVLKVAVGKKEVTKTNYTNIDGIYVDKSYTDKEKSSKKMVYLFYTVTSSNENIKLSSTLTGITIDDKNKYDSEIYSSHKPCEFMGNYYYSKYLKEVNVGETLKVVETFEIPSADLKSGKPITFVNSHIPETEELCVLTDSIVFCDSAENIAKKVDPKGYKAEKEKQKNADSSTMQKVKNSINGYYWTCYVNSTSYKVEFSDPDIFTVTGYIGRASSGGRSGTYSVKNGYIYCTYPDTGYTVKIPYEFKDGNIDLDIVAAFDVNE